MESIEYVFLNGKFKPIDDAKISVKTHAFLYGTSVFEGIRTYWNDKDNQLYVFRMKEHYERILNSAKIMHMQTPYSVEELCNYTIELLKKNQHKTDAYIRPTIYKSSAKKIGPHLDGIEDSTMMFTMELGNYVDIDNGLKVCVSSWKRSDDNAIPPRAKISGCYANTALIITDAKLSGFDEAIVLGPDGHVTEGSAMNLFLVQKGKLITPKTTDNILVGVTRNTVKELSCDLGIEVIEREVDRTELYISDEAFYCGTGAQISPIVSIDNRDLGDGKVGVITKKLQNAYFDVVKGNNNKYKKWCTPVYD